MFALNTTARIARALLTPGHAIVATLVSTGDPVSKISIIPRSRGALGYTIQMPKEDRYLLSIGELEDRIAVMIGGRAAEQVMLGTISTGAVDDIQRATQLARRMVTEFGMSDRLGSVRYAGPQLQCLGSGIVESRDVSAATHETIDAEVRRNVGDQFARAMALLAAHRDALGDLSAQLLAAESLDGRAVREALASATRPAA